MSKDNKTIDINKIKEAVMLIKDEFPISKVTLFGSRADKTNSENSDVDLIIEFSKSISLLTLSSIKIKLENILNIKVDIIHGPITENDMIEIKNEINLYAA